MALLSTLGVLNPVTNSAQPALPLFAAEQAGTWISLVKLNSGLMNMSLVEDTAAGVLGGEVTLLLNKFTNSIPADVSGIYYEWNIFGN